MSTKKYRIYLDVCCYSRPFDDQRQERIRLEAEAVLLILNNCQKGIWDLIGSEAIDFEISKIRDPIKRFKVESLYAICKNKVKIDEEIRLRAKELQSLGFKALDALHIACAEYGKADVLLTTDDDLTELASKRVLKVKVKNPCVWLLEVM